MILAQKLQLYTSRLQWPLVLYDPLRVLSSSAAFVKVSLPSSADPGCPLKRKGYLYILKPESKLPVIRKLDYIDAGIVWRNFHSDQVEICHSSDYDNCLRINRKWDHKLVAFWTPSIINSDSLDEKAITDSQNWYQHKWPLFHDCVRVYSAEAMEFCLGISRMCAGLNADHSVDRQRLFLLTMVSAFVFDDVSEALLQEKETESLFPAWRNNLDRIVNGKEKTVSRIDFKDLKGFPNKQLQRASLCEEMLSDLMIRMRHQTSGATVKLFQRGYHYFMDHVAKEGKLRLMLDRGSDHASKIRFVEAKSAINGATLALAPLFDEYSAQFLTPQDPFLTTTDNAVGFELDAMSYFKENMAGQEIGNVAACSNVLEWYVQVAGLPIRQAFAHVASDRNSIVRAMIQMHNHLNPRDQPRAMQAIKVVLQMSDYTVRLGIDQLNPSEATANVDQETDCQIQKAIKNKFSQCTVITIAHRLNTVIDMDMILVMDQGRVAEYDHPFLLLQNASGHFYAMVKETGHAFAKGLHDIARHSYLQKSNQFRDMKTD